MDVPDAVSAVVRQEFPGSDIRAVERLSGGCKDTYRVELSERAVVAAFPREAWYEPQFALEPAMMRLVREATSVPVPRVLATDVSGTAMRPYHVTDALDGESLDGRLTGLDHVEQTTLVGAVGRALAELHDGVRFDASGPLVPADTDRGVRVDARSSWPTFLSELVDTWLTELSDSRFADLAPTYRQVLTPESVVSTDVEPACLHFDYGPRNLLTRGETLVGVVDWGFAVAGHAEYDLFQCEKNLLLGQVDDPTVRETLRPHLYAGYRERASLAPGWERRRAFYRVAYKLASMRSFHRWTAGMDATARDRMATRLRDELQADLERFRTMER